MKTFLILLFVLCFSSCGGHLVKDIHPNPSVHGYHRMEFDIQSNGVLKKEIGIGNIFVLEDQDLNGIYFEFKGIYKGTLYIKSSACGIDVNTNFEGNTRFYLTDLVPNPTKCSIRFVAETEPLKKREHNIVESGVIKLNVIPTGSKPLTMEYTRTNTIAKALYQNYSYVGQGSMQRQGGDLTRKEKFMIKTDLVAGGRYRVFGCNMEKTGEFLKDSFEISLYDLYKKKLLTREDSCDFEITVLPNAQPDSRYGRFSLNIYGTEVVKLEPLKYEIKKKFASKKKNIKAEGRKYVILCSINDEVKTSNKCKHDYEPGKIYWLRAITGNARKSVFAIKDGQVIWKE